MSNMSMRRFVNVLGLVLLSLTVLAATGRAAQNAEWKDEDGTGRVLEVSQGDSYELTAEDVATLVASGRDFVVRGAGTVVCAVDMSAFAKDAVIERGIAFVMTVPDCFGSEKGSVTVRDGASILLNTTNARVLQNKTLYFEGVGPDGKGAIQIRRSAWNSFSGDKFLLTGDAKIDLGGRADCYDILDTCGHNLEIVGRPWATSWWMSFGGTLVTNSAETASTIVCLNNKVQIKQWHGNPFGGSADNVFCLSNGCYYTKWNVENGWTLAFHGDSSGIEADVWVADGATAGLDICRFSGPMDVRGSTRFTVRTNSVVTVAGPLSGSGTITVDGGWLNLASENITYTGQIAVRAKAVHEPGWRAGLALRTDTALPLSGLSFADADLKLTDTFATSLPPLAFAGEGATNRVTGGHLSRQRSACPRLTVADGATVELSSPIALSEASVGAGGTLRVVRVASLVGNPGLMGYAAYPESMVWSFTKPTEEEIAADYTTYYPHGTDLLTVPVPLGERRKRNYRLHGYIWNRSETAATWSFLANFNDRVFMWLDGKQIYKDVGRYISPPEARVVTVSDLAPGPHEIVMNFTANDTSSGPCELEPDKSVCCAMGFDSLGRGRLSDFSTYYQPLIDPGDGSLLTVDQATEADESLYCPSFSNLAFGSGATFDGGGLDQTVNTLRGCPTVANVPTLTVNERFTVNAAEFVAGGLRPCTADGVVAFGPDAVIDVEIPEPLTAEQRAALKAGVTVLSAQSVRGAPRLSEAAKRAHLTLRQEGDALRLGYAKGAVIVVR